MSVNIDELSCAQLKELLKRAGLSSTGVKAELKKRIISASLPEQFLQGILEDSAQEDFAKNTTMAEQLLEEELTVFEDDHAEKVSDSEVRLLRREMEIMRKEKELIAKDLELAKRETQLLREIHNIRDVRPLPRSMQEEQEKSYPPVPKMAVSAVAELLDFFDGSGTAFERWEQQVRLLRTVHQLGECECKILVGSRLRGKALEWFHSKPDHIKMPFDDFFSEMRTIFDHRPGKAARRRQFEERIWRHSESFSEYFHHKIILGNRVPIPTDEMVDEMIRGIPDSTLRDMAMMHRFRDVKSLLEAFEEVVLRPRGCQRNGGGGIGGIGGSVSGSGIGGVGGSGSGSGIGIGGSGRGIGIGISNNISGGGIARGNGTSSGVNRAIEGERRRQVGVGSSATGWCGNCGARGHRAADCWLRERGPKCFECREFGHVSANCPTKRLGARAACTAPRAKDGKCYKSLTVNGHEIVALIDTGSDLSIMRADAYVEIGAPTLIQREILFDGVGSQENKTLGEFSTTVTVDGESYPITIRVVPDRLMAHKFLIGTDFLNRATVSIRGGQIEISKFGEAGQENEHWEEILPNDIGREVFCVNTGYEVNPTYQAVIEKLVSAYRPQKSRETGVQMSIILKDDEPVYQRARRLAVPEREIVNAQVSEWLHEGIVQPSLSEYASPVVLVKKKDGSHRLCVDYRQLNKKIVRDRFPLPLVDDQLDALQGARIFSTLDLKNGFFHVPVHPASRKYTAFIIPDGHYEFRKVPFGLCNSPAVFQRFINATFRELITQGTVLTYMDDLIVPANDIESGLQKLKTVLGTAAETGLEINWKKCRFLQQRVEYLGHVIEDGSVRPSPGKTDAIRRFPMPTTTKQIQSFLGLTGYFRKFVLNYAVIARPLSDRLRNETKFEIGTIEKNAVAELKKILCTDPVLKLYRVNAETELHTDASKYGFGAILMQRNSEDNALHPIYYASGRTSRAEEKYPSYELEALAIVKAVKKFRTYLLGTRFKIVTDCQAFKMTLCKRDLCVRIARWALFLEDFNYIVEHRSGKNMAHVDALSRAPLPSVLTTDITEEGLVNRLRKAQEEDRDLIRVLEMAKEGRAEGYMVRGGLLFKEVNGDIRMVVPRAMQSRVIRRAHENGHFSTAKTLWLVERDYWFPNMRDRVEKIIRNCIDCILIERKQGKQEGLLHSLDKGELPLHTYHIDHLGPVPSTKKRYRHILVICDAFSKYVWLYATRSTDSAEVIMRLKAQAVVFGNPAQIISDRGTAFSSRMFAEYCEEERVQHIMTTVGVPRANGQVERINRTLIPLLAKLSTPKPELWYKYLGIAQQYLNTTPNRSIGTTPFHVLFGTHMRLRENQPLQELIEQDWTAAFQKDRDQLREQAMKQIAKVQQENRKTFNRKRVEATSYQVGDLVAIRRTQNAPGLKLAAKFLGPYSIEKVLRNERYVVRKVGDHEGPLQTSTAADQIKRWIPNESDVSDTDSDGT